jgi:cytochrome c peroxidase
MLFNSKARCNTCHAGNAVAPLFSDSKFHNIGVAAHKQDFVQLAGEGLKTVRSGDQKQIDELALNSKFSELGRFMVTKSENDVGAFKTPTLRNTGVTGPYMHDGSMATLWDVMDHYNKGGTPNPYLDGGMQRLGLTETEIDDVVAFLFSLTSDKFAALQKTEAGKQKALKNKRPERDVAAATGKKGDLGDVAPTPDFSKKDPSNLGLYGPVSER